MHKQQNNHSYKEPTMQLYESYNLWGKWKKKKKKLIVRRNDRFWRVCLRVL